MVSNMTTIQEKLMVAFKQVDSFISLPHVFGFSTYTLGTDLISSIEENGYIPYVIGKRERYRSSPLSTCLLYLWQAGLLPIDVAKVLRKRLFEIRDRMPPQETRAPRTKAKEDAHAWCVSEGASVWSTSMALIALLESRLDNNREQDRLLIESATWLMRQQDKHTGGWAFQRTSNSCPTVPMTSLALGALSRIHTLSSLSSQFRDELQAAYVSGYSYLVSKLVRKQCTAYWEFDGLPNLTATVWALDALRFDPRTIDHDIPKAEIIAFALSKIPSQESEWESECFVSEPETKYSHQKTFYSFMPALLPSLFAIGLSPIELKVVNVITQLIQSGQNKWRIKKYNMEPCTFTHAMALYTLIKWNVYVQNTLVNAFFPLKRTSVPLLDCPVLKTIPSRCNAKLMLRRAHLFLVLCLFCALTVFLTRPSSVGALLKCLDGMAPALSSPWPMTLIGGTVTSLFAGWIMYKKYNKEDK